MVLVGHPLQIRTDEKFRLDDQAAPKRYPKLL